MAARELLNKQTETHMDIFEMVDGKSKESYRVWDEHIPIVKSGREVDVYITTEIVDPINYNELCHTLREATSKEVIRLHINTPGGRLDSATMIIDAIAQSDAYVIGVLSGTVASAGTMIALACDELECSSYLEFMIHYFSGGTGGKGNEIKAHSSFINKHMPMIFKKMYAGFLTESEIDDVIEGKDVWLNGDEVLERFETAKLGDINE